MGRVRRGRRGANAIEFALVAPVLLTMVLGTMDYGWYFLNEWFAMNAVREAVRLGSMQAPTDAEAAGQCASCVSTTASKAVTLLDRYGITVNASDVTPTIIGIDGTCALSLEPSIPHTPLVGFVTVPDHYVLDTVWFLQNVSGC